jgi:mannobiose 2-epimerase
MHHLAEKLKSECKTELTARIIPFWNGLRDDEQGGFYGLVDENLRIDKEADKGFILLSRVLWFYSACHRVLGGGEHLANARHVYEFIAERGVDRENGGVYWSATYDGKVADGLKHAYTQAFAVYALSEYFLASGDGAALDLALSIFDVTEDKCADGIAYVEAFDADWKPAANEKLSENGIAAEKTMNTVLHMIEAYTVLYEASKRAAVASKLRFLIELTINRIFDENNAKLFVFFDKNLNPLGDIHSYGHDIEAAWLIGRACDVLGDGELSERWRNIALATARNILRVAYENGAVNNERDGARIDKNRVWWVQAESVVGFADAYERGGDVSFLEAAANVWEYIKNYQADSRPSSEWHGVVDYGGRPLPSEMAGPWKCPYHNGRMCIEILKRKF